MRCLRNSGRRASGWSQQWSAIFLLTTIGVLYAGTSRGAGDGEAELDGLPGKLISTLDFTSLRGHGRAILTQKDGEITVTVHDLSLVCRARLKNAVLTGLRIGLLSPQRRFERKGARYGDRIRENFPLDAGSVFEPGEFSATFRGGGDDVDLEDYGVCLQVLQVVDGGQEAMVFAHTGEPTTRRDFSRQRDGEGMTLKELALDTPAVAKLHADWRRQLDHILVAVSQSRAVYEERLRKEESKALETGRLQEVLALKGEVAALGEEKLTDLSEFAQLQAAQEKFVETVKAHVSATLPEIVEALRGYDAALEKWQNDARSADRDSVDLLDKAAVTAERKRVAKLLTKREAIPTGIDVPWISTGEKEKR